MSDAPTRSATRLGVATGFAAIYLIWGSTYLAIRFAVETLPPFMLAGVRFSVAGALMYLWAMRRGHVCPTQKQWRSAIIVGGLLLLGGNGLVTFAEQTVPSGVAALIVATVPLWMVLLGWAQPGGVRPGALVFVGLALGFIGVAVLIDPFSGGADAAVAHAIDRVGAMALLVAALSWSIGSLYARRANLPSSLLVATAAEMFAGGLLLVAVGLATGEAARIDPSRISLTSLLALAYLIAFGSLIGFTAYVWLLSVTTPARVSTYAYVNPVVAVLLGWVFAGEPITATTLAAMAIIVLSVAMITTRAAHGAVKPGVAPATPPMIQRSAPRCAIQPTIPSVSTDDLDANGVVHALAQVRARRSDADREYIEFLRSSSLSVGVYELPAGGVDGQQPHAEDEVYYIVNGRATLRIGEDEHPVEPGSVAFVAAQVPHAFHSIIEPLTALVFFAPPEGGAAWDSLDATREALRVDDAPVTAECA